IGSQVLIGSQFVVDLDLDNATYSHPLNPGKVFTSKGNGMLIKSWSPTTEVKFTAMSLETKFRNYLMHDKGFNHTQIKPEHITWTDVIVHGGYLYVAVTFDNRPG